MKMTLALMALLVGAGSLHAAVSQIPATGWNHDMVIDGAGPYNTSVTGTMDGGLSTFENWTWVEQGSYTDSGGNVQNFQGLAAGTHSSLTGNGTFTFQPFSGNNVVALNGGESGVLTLGTPASYSSIALYGASGFGSKSATITLTFSDSSTTVLNVANGTGIGSDWFNSNPDKAFVAGGRASNRGEEGYTRLYYQGNGAIGINESFFTLDAADQSKLLSSVTIQNTGGDRMVVFALSGEAVPEPSSLVLLGGLGALAWRRKRA